VVNRTRAKAEPLFERGAVWHDTPGEVASVADVVITMVGMPTDVEEVYLGVTPAVPTGQGIIERVRPILALMRKSVTLVGPAGAGQRCKLANQVAVAIGMVAWCEAFAHAQAGGLDSGLVQQVISGGAAGSWGLSNLAPWALAGDFAPASW